MDMKKRSVDEKIDELAQMVAGGFSEMHKDIARVGTKVDEIEENYVVKEDIIRLRGDVDIMLDKHIGTFRKDYDDLATRVKKLEQRVFAR